MSTEVATKEFNPNRSGFLDNLRGLAIINMIVFHFCFDLKMFNLIQGDFVSGGWRFYSISIAGTFLFCVGASLYYAHAKKIIWDQFISRSLKLLVAACAVSLSTFIAFPEQWVYFGILHCIFVGSILGLWFVKHRIAAALVMVSIMIAQYAAGYDLSWVSVNFTRRFAVDFIPIYPWFWVILLGIVCAPYLNRIKFVNSIKPNSHLAWLSRRSLVIYLIHQPLILALMHLTQWLLNFSQKA